MQDNMDRMWRRFGSFNHEDGGGMEAWAAPLDVVADGDDFVVRASLPGVSPDNIHVAIEDDVLTIRGETASHFENTEGNYLMRERPAAAPSTAPCACLIRWTGQGRAPLRARRADHHPAQGPRPSGPGSST